MAESLLKWLGFRVLVGLLPLALAAFGLALTKQPTLLTSIVGRGELLLIVVAICAGAIGDIVAAPKPKGLPQPVVLGRMAATIGCLVTTVACAFAYATVRLQPKDYDVALVATLSLWAYGLGFLAAASGMYIVELVKLDKS